jgi:hypothetical protein
VLVEVTQTLGGRAVEIVRGLVDPDHAAWLQADHADQLADRDDGGWVPPGEPSRLGIIATALPWLAYRLSPADPAWAALVAAYDRLRPLLRHPDLVIDLGAERADRPMPPSVSEVGRRDGWKFYRLHADRLSGPDDPALTLFGGQRTVAGLRTLLSAEFAAFVDALREPGPGAWPHDPRTSVPDLVDAVAGEHGLSTDAAAHYLQLLALPDPTDRNIQNWTGWTAAAFKKIRAELAATDLVVEAKRARAGRSLFLPGGWRPLKAPKLPIEAWKAEMYDVSEWSLPITVLRTVPDLFRLAWQRVVDGDRPALQALGEAR